MGLCGKRSQRDETQRNQKVSQGACADSAAVAAFAHIRRATSAHKAWINLQKTYEDTGLFKRFGPLQVLFSTKLKECESEEKYINKITDISHQLTNTLTGLDD